MKKIIGFCALSLVLTSPVFAQKTAETSAEKNLEKAVEKEIEKTAEPDTADFPVLEKLKGDKKDLSYDYLGNRFGIDAWLLSGPGVMQIVYVPPTSKGAVLSGALIGDDGKEASSELTRNFMTEYPERAQEILAIVNKETPGKKTENPADKTPPVKAVLTSPSEILWQKLQQGGAVTFNANSKTPELYAILDPVQLQTKALWNLLLPLIKEKKITVHILPLGLTTADSIMEIAFILGNKDPQTAWSNLMIGKSAIVKETPETSGVLGMKANVDLAQSMSLRTLPFLVYRGENDKIRIVKGLPKDWKAFQKDLTR